jgi:hypothetical protein
MRHTEHQELRHYCRDWCYGWNDDFRQIRNRMFSIDFRLAGLHRPHSEHFRLLPREPFPLFRVEDYAERGADTSACSHRHTNSFCLPIGAF